MEYIMEMVDVVSFGDEVVEQGDVCVLIVLMVQMYIFGIEIDYEIGLLELGFKFCNLNVIEVCGCGEFVSFVIFGVKV